MANDEKTLSRDIVGKTVVSKTGKRFGEVGDIVFETNSGELIHMILNNPTPYAQRLDLEADRVTGKMMFPVSAVIATGDYVVVSEEDLG